MSASNLEKLAHHYANSPVGILRIGVASDFLYGVCGRKSYNSARISINTHTLAQNRILLRRLNQLPQLLDECRALGWSVMEYHPKTKQPIAFNADGMNVRMSALGKSDEGFPHGWFLIEARAISDKLFAKVVEQRLLAAYPALYGHCILGMGYAKLSQCAVFLSSDSGRLILKWYSLIDRCLTSYKSSPKPCYLLSRPKRRSVMNVLTAIFNLIVGIVLISLLFLALVVITASLVSEVSIAQSMSVAWKIVMQLWDAVSTSIIHR
jgi:hypothetical protein